MARYDNNERAHQLYDWGMNSKILALSDGQCENILDSFGIYDCAERDLFWEGYQATPTRNYLASITITGDNAMACL